MKALERTVRGVVATVALMATSACSQIVGITDLPVADGGTSSSGDDQGDGDSGAPFKGEAFLGTWSTTAASQNVVTCPGQSPGSTSDANESTTIVRGTESDLTTAAGCMYKFDVTSPTTMTLVEGQTCVETTPDGTGTVTIHPEGTFTITSAGTTGTLAFSGTATVVDPGLDEDGTCSFTETDQYQKDQ